MENPSTNSTTPGNPTYLWVGEPKQRGTFGIVVICFSTLISFVWNTVHFNVPIKRLPLKRRIFTHVLWMVIALLIPEFLLYLAINQWVDAFTLVKNTLDSTRGWSSAEWLFGCTTRFVDRLVWTKDVST